MPSKVGGLAASLQVVNLQLSPSQAAFISTESMCDESWALVDAEAKKYPGMEEIQAEVRCRLYDNSALLRSAHKMFRYDVDWALHD